MKPNQQATPNTYTPEYLVSPGDVLEDHLSTLGITQPALATRAGLELDMVENIIQEKAAIDAEFAAKLEAVFGLPARFWLKLEDDYQEDMVRLYG